ncbi:MAG: hypothetical protein AAGF83_12275 [Cyanobacteria bacterium P01_G01_bin.67]
MVERLKRWESPRKKGRNDKGKGGSARARQLRKREQMLRQKLKQKSVPKSRNSKKREGNYSLSFFLINSADIFIVNNKY